MSEKYKIETNSHKIHTHIHTRYIAINFGGCSQTNEGYGDAVVKTHSACQPEVWRFETRVLHNGVRSCYLPTPAT